MIPKARTLGESEPALRQVFRRIAAAASLLLLSLGGRSFGQNLVQNGEFDTDLSHWTISSIPGGSVVWSSDDYAGSPNSGSALMINAIPCVEIDPGVFECPSTYMTQCVPLQPEMLYRFGFAGKALTNQTSSGTVHLFFEWHTGPACDGATLSSPLIGLAPTSSWQFASSSALTRAGVNSGLVRILLARDFSLTGDFRAEVDHVFVEPAQPLAEVPALGTAGLATLAAGLGIAGWFLTKNRPG